VHATPDLKLSEEAFPTGSTTAELAAEVVEEIELGEPAVEAEVLDPTEIVEGDLEAVASVDDPVSEPDEAEGEPESGDSDSI